MVVSEQGRKPKYRAPATVFRIVKTPKQKALFFGEALNLNPNPTPEALNPNPKQFLHPTGLASGAREQHTSAVVLGFVFWSCKVYYRLSNLQV